MRDYIILNGVNSNTITGLLISTLPPITKPKIRTQTEEIDGRDGDIVTKLGYSAYDKEIEIGLYGDFDINEVIAYFNSEGTVTFSNEPDKFYNYQILDQIDYDKLIRFKKAKIKMHVQPFKYPLEEDPVEITIQTVNNEAEEMDLDNTKEAPIQIALKGNTSQNTTTGINKVKLLDKSQTTSGGVTYSVSNQILTLSGTATGINILFEFNDITLPAGTYYFYLLRTKTTRVDISLRTTNNASISGANFGNIFQNTLTNKSFTLSTDTLIHSMNLWFPSGVDTTDTYKVMICTASHTATEYEPYTNGASPNPDYPQEVSVVSGDNIITIENSDSSESQNYHITLPEGTELCKIGDYQDRIYKDSGKWYIEKQVGKVILDGSQATTTVATNTTGKYRHYTVVSPLAKGTGLELLGTYCDELKAINRNDSYICTQGICYSSDGEGNRLITYIDDTSSMDTNTFNTWLSSNPLTVYYVIKEPTTTEITDTTLKNQLEALANATSYDTKTHITQNSNDKPFILNATAEIQGSGEATVENEGNIYSKPTLDIEGSGTVGIYLDGNQMFSVDLSNANECIIDTAQLEAYNPSTDALMNRQVTGDYSNFKLNAGENQVSTTGDITKVTISNYTRWL